MLDGVFTVDVYGVFEEGALEILWRDEPRPARASLDEMVARTWARCEDEARSEGVLLFNGPMVRHLRHRVGDGRLAIEVGPTDYANFMGTNYCNYARGDEFGWELYGNPIGTSASLITSDGWVLYGRRSGNVACHAGYVHTFGGCLEPADRRGDGSFDGFECLRRELKEELGFEPADVTRMVCLGLIRDATIRQPELIFDAYVGRSRSEIEARLRPGDPHAEHESIVALRDEAAAVVPFIRGTRRLAPIATGAVCLHGRRRFGEAWYAETVRVLAGA